MTNKQNNNQTTNESIDKALESLENTTEAASENEVDVEVVKGDTVIYEDGDFDDFNSEQNLDSNADESNKANSQQAGSKEADTKEESTGVDKYSAAIANLYQWAKKLKDDFLAEKAKNSDSNKESDAENTSDSNKENTSEKEGSDKEDKHSVSIANIYQWAAQLKEDFSFETSHMAHDVSDKALAIMLNKLLSSVELELATFNKKVEESEQPVANVKEERSKIEAKKKKYQGMIDLLQAE